MRMTVKTNVGNHTQAGDAEVNDIIQAVSREVTEEFTWSQRYRETVIVTIPPYGTGTVGVTEGLATIIGTGTTWTAAMVGRRLTIAGLDAPLYVVAVGGPTGLTLGDAQLAQVAWPLASGSGKTYSIFASEYELPEGVALVRENVEQFPLEEVPSDFIERVDPRRSSRGKPTKYSLVRTRIDGTPARQRTFIEFWPVPSAALVIRVPFFIEAPALTGDLDMPACPSQLIELLSTSRVADFIYSKTGDARWSNLSDRYYRRFFGGGNDVGALERMKADDEARQPLARRLSDGPAPFSYEYLQSHDLG